MPEIGECYTIARKLPTGNLIQEVKISPRFNKYIAKSKNIKQYLSGAQLLAPEAYGKALLFPMVTKSGLAVLVSQLGMSGSWFLDTQGRSIKNDHLVITTAEHEFRYSDPRMFGKMRWFAIPPGQTLADFLPTLRRHYNWGVDPHRASASELNQLLATKWSRTSKNVKQLLLEQNVVFGIGNYLASEILYAAQISPYRRGRELSTEAIQRLVTAMQRIVALAIRTGGYSFAGGYYHPDGSRGSMAKYIRAYEHAGEACTRGCGAKIVKEFITGRSTYYCPRCQRRKL